MKPVVFHRDAGNGRANLQQAAIAMHAKVCALDFGGKRVGVALSDELRFLAHPQQALPAKPEPALLAALTEMFVREGVRQVIIGLPIDMRGGEGESARKARGFAQRVANATGCEVELWDERLSTVQAKRALDASGVAGRKQRALIDSASACALLQAWLDRGGGRRG
jgi:putative holliday junction resolvase